MNTYSHALNSQPQSSSTMVADDATPLHRHIQVAIERYLANLEGEEPVAMYEHFLHQLERPLFEAVLRHTRGNQSRTALMLGLNRGTLRTKLKQHGLLQKTK